MQCSGAADRVASHMKRLPDPDRQSNDWLAVREATYAGPEPVVSIRMFASVGIGQTDSNVLREALLAVARNSEADRGGPSPYGRRDIVD